MRKNWARRMSSLLSQDGILIALQHPLDKHEGGPPWSLSSELYEELLSPYFDNIWLKKPNKGFDLELAKHDVMSVWRKKASN